jgi:hypothetical protein
MKYLLCIVATLIIGCSAKSTCVSTQACDGEKLTRQWAETIYYCEKYTGTYVIHRTCNNEISYITCK